MEPKETITTTPASSDMAGVGESRDIVPVARPSSSDDGRNAVYVTGTAQDMATATINSEDERAKTDVASSSKAEHRALQIEESSISLSQGVDDNKGVMKTFSPKIPDSWVHIVEEEEKASIIDLVPLINVDMEDEGPSIRTASKRKKACHIESDSLDDSASNVAKGPKLRARPYRKRTIITSERVLTGVTSKDCEVQVCSNPDSALSGIDREDRHGKPGRPRRKAKAVDPIIVEQEILKKIVDRSRTY